MDYWSPPSDGDSCRMPAVTTPAGQRRSPSRFTAVAGLLAFVACDSAGNERLWLIDANGAVKSVGARYAQASAESSLSQAGK